MALRNYKAEDEDDYYGQPFLHEGVVSIWVSNTDLNDLHPDIDILQDLCGVGYYSLDDYELNGPDNGTEPIEQLLTRVSFSGSFLAEAQRAALAKGVHQAKWVLAQFEFAYDSTKVRRTISPEVVFLGVFPYSDPGNHAEP